LYQAAFQWKDFSNIVEFTTALPNINDVSSIKVYPNPVRDYLTVEGVAADTKMSIIDLNGRVLMQQKLNIGNSVSLQSLLRGQYILQFADSKGVNNFRITKE
jgi:hypothetical protein